MSLPSCPICMSCLETTDDVCVVACGHAFHYACVSQWVDECREQKQSSTCPTCKRPINLRKTSGTIRKLYFYYDPVGKSKEVRELEAKLEAEIVKRTEAERNETASKQKVNTLLTETESLTKIINTLESELEKAEREKEFYARNYNGHDAENKGLKRKVSWLDASVAAYKEILVEKIRTLRRENQRETVRLKKVIEELKMASQQKANMRIQVQRLVKALAQSKKRNEATRAALNNLEKDHEALLLRLKRDESLKDRSDLENSVAVSLERSEANGLDVEEKEDALQRTPQPFREDLQMVKDDVHLPLSEMASFELSSTTRDEAPRPSSSYSATETSPAERSRCPEELTKTEAEYDEIGVRKCGSCFTLAIRSEESLDALRKKVGALEKEIVIERERAAAKSNNVERNYDFESRILSLTMRHLDRALEAAEGYEKQVPEIERLRDECLIEGDYNASKETNSPTPTATKPEGSKMLKRNKLNVDVGVVLHSVSKETPSENGDDYSDDTSDPATTEILPEPMEGDFNLNRFIRVGIALMAPYVILRSAIDKMLSLG